MRPRNGPPLAVSTMRARSAPPPVLLARRHWCTAQCSESTGTSSAPGVARAICTTGPAAISDSLFASASRLPPLSVARVTGSPANPTTPFTTTSASSASDASASGPLRTSHSGSASLSVASCAASAIATTFGRTARACSISRSTDDDAPSATTSNRSASAATTSRVCTPIEPVEPATATRVVTDPGYAPLDFLVILTAYEAVAPREPAAQKMLATRAR